MPNKKQSALELAKTEERLSGIPKGGSTLKGTSKAERKALVATALGISGVAAGALLPSLIFGTRGVALAKGAKKMAPTALKKLNRVYKQLQKTTMESAKAPGTKKMKIKGKKTEVKVPKKAGMKRVGGAIGTATYLSDDIKDVAGLVKEYGSDTADILQKLLDY